MADDYVTSMLSNEETIQAEARQHWMALIRFALQPIIVLLVAVGCLLVGIWLNPTGDGLFGDLFRFVDTLLGLITAGLFVLAAVWFPIQVFRWLKRRYLVTDRRVLYVEGVLRRNSRDAQLQMITDVGFRQTFLGRRMGYGDLNIATASNRPLEFREMRDAIAFKKVIMAAQQGTIVKRANEITGATAGVPNVAEVARAIDPASVPVPEPTWDGGDVPQMAEDDVPPADPAIFGAGTEAAVSEVEPAVAVADVEPAAVAESAAEPADVEPEPAVVDARPVADVAAGTMPEPAAEPAPTGATATAADTRTPTSAMDPSASTLTDIDRVIDLPAEATALSGTEAVTEALAKLADLRDSGAITEAEFDTKKQELLDRL